MSIRTCANCGHEITNDDRFCSNCGARQEPVSAIPDTDTPVASSGPQAGHVDDPNRENGPTAPVIPSLGRKNAWEYERDRVRGGADDDEWKMSALGPPPPRRRRTWLWIVIGILALMVLACCIFMYWIGYTDGGQEWFEGIATEAAEIVEATEQAATPAS